MMSDNGMTGNQSEARGSFGFHRQVDDGTNGFIENEDGFNYDVEMVDINEEELEYEGMGGINALHKARTSYSDSEESRMRDTPSPNLSETPTTRNAAHDSSPASPLGFEHVLFESTQSSGPVPLPTMPSPAPRIGRAPAPERFLKFGQPQQSIPSQTRPSSAAQFAGSVQRQVHPGFAAPYQRSQSQGGRSKAPKTQIVEPPTAFPAVTVSPGILPETQAYYPPSLTEYTRSLWCERELDIIGTALNEYSSLKERYAYVVNLYARLGFYRPPSAIKDKLVSSQIHSTESPTLEQSLDLRELNQELGSGAGRWARIAQTSGVTLSTAQMHMNQVQRAGKENLLPVPWSPVEDRHLLTYVSYHHDALLLVRGAGLGTLWAHLKKPLVGRSIAACKRRYERIHRDLWTRQEIVQLVQTTKAFISENRWPNWFEIAKGYPNRSPLMCAMLYAKARGILDYNPGREPW